MLSEAYAYAPYKDRVLATRDFVRECLTQAAAHKAEIIRLVERSRARRREGRPGARGDDRVADSLGAPAPAQSRADPRLR